MKRINKILAACDMSPYSELVLGYAVELAQNMHCHLVIVNVINQKTVNMMVESKTKIALSDNRLATSVDDYISNLKNERSNEIKKMFAKTDHEHVRARIILKVGVPHQKLIECAKEELADLIIMGPKGRSDLSDVLFGSTADKMFRQCTIPILSIPLSEKQDRPS